MSIGSLGRRALLRAIVTIAASGAALASSGCAYKQLAPIIGYSPPLFEATHPDRPATVRLFGSVHAGLPRFYPLPDSIERAYAASTRVAIELDAAKHHSALRRAVAPMSLYEPGQSLETAISPKLLAELRDYYRYDLHEWRQVRMMKPWAIALSMVSADDANLAATGSEGIESHVLARAGRDGKPVHELETAAEQAFAFAGGTLSEQEAVLALRLEQVRSFDKTFSRIIDAWRVGDERQLAALKLHAYPLQGPVAGNHRRIFSDRDQRMVERLDRLAAEPGDLFVVVGAFHLAGDDSMIHRMRAMGWKVRRVNDTQRGFGPQQLALN